MIVGNATVNVVQEYSVYHGHTIRLGRINFARILWKASARIHLGYSTKSVDKFFNKYVLPKMAMERAMHSFSEG